MVCAEDMGEYFRVPPHEILNYGKYIEQMGKTLRSEDYNSHNTHCLDVAGMQALLMKLTFMPSSNAVELTVACRGNMSLRIYYWRPLLAFIGKIFSYQTQ